MADSKTGSTGWNAWKAWETIKLETHQVYPELGLITLNRPDNLNALNETLITNFNQCMDFLNHALDCRVAILCGAGRLFCAGTDMKRSKEEAKQHDWTHFPDKVKQQWQVQHELSQMFVKLRSIPQPVIAAVHGAAVGGGMAFANASDMVVASREVRFINAFIKIGLSGADCASTYYLPRILGFHRSAELLYSGRDLSAEEAYQWGYVNILVDKPEETVPAAVAFAADYMLTKSPLGLRLTKEAVNNNMDSPSLEAALKIEDRNQVVCSQTDDRSEGVSAFLEKRRPKYGPR